MYGEINGQVRINGIASNFQNKRYHGKKYQKPKKKFEEYFEEEQRDEPKQSSSASSIDFKY